MLPSGLHVRCSAALIVAAVLVTPWFAAACTAVPGQTTAAPTAPVDVEPPVADVAPASGSTARAATSATATLTLWSVSELEPTPDEGLSTLATTWADGDPLVALRVSLRPGRGVHGIVAYLDVLSRTAASELPHVVSLPLSEVAAARSQGLILPLPEVLADSPQLAQSWPFARAAVTDGPGEAGRPWAIPLAVTIAHVAWRTSVEPPPTTWQDLLTQPRLALPTGADSSALATMLSLYAAQGGDPATLPAVDREPASAWLGDLAAGRDAIDATESPLAALVSGEAEAALTGAGSFVAAWDSAELGGWSALPGPNGPAPVVATGWALALVARPAVDMGRSVALIEAVTGEIAPRWTYAAGLLPANRAAWAESLRAGPEPPPTAYRDFIALRLESARSPSAMAGTAPRWAEAARAVLDGDEIPPVLDTLTAPR